MMHFSWHIVVLPLFIDAIHIRSHAYKNIINDHEFEYCMDLFHNSFVFFFISSVM